jgi:hypothetical protein
MNRITSEWTTEKLEKLKSMSINYSIKEKEKIKFLYLNNLLVKIPELEIDKNDILINELNVLIDSLPKDFEELIDSDYLSKFNDIEYLVRKRFSLIPNKQHHIVTINPFSFANIIGYVFTGVIIYLAFLFFNKPILVIGIAVPLSFVVSKSIELYRYKIAKKENRLI